jgi:hypothetical protein
MQEILERRLMGLRHDHGGNGRDNQRQVVVEGVAVFPRACMTAELQTLVLLWARRTMVALYLHQLQSFPDQKLLLMTFPISFPAGPLNTNTSKPISLNTDGE